jgi:molybdate transport system permease protein
MDRRGWLPITAAPGPAIEVAAARVLKELPDVASHSPGSDPHVVARDRSVPVKGVRDERSFRLAGTPSLLLAGVLCLFLILPLVGLLLRAMTAGGLLTALGRPIVVDALRLSFFTTSAVLILSLVFGSPLALVLARRRFRGITLVDSLVDLPIVLPPAVAGLALLLTFGRRGLLGTPLSAIGIELPFTTAAVIMASFFVAAPFYVRAARSGFLAVPREYEEAARMEGANEWDVFRYITVPVAAPALFGGAILCWARSLGEFGATIMFAGQFLGRTQTMPLAIYAALESDTDAALGLSVLLLLISFAMLVFFRRFLGAASERA